MNSNIDGLNKFCIFLIICITSLLQHTTIQAADLLLTETEKTWIAEHPSIILGFNPDMQPVLIQGAEGNHTGILPEIFNQLEDLTGLDIKIKVGPWHSIIKQAKRGDIDGLLNCVPTLAKSTGLSTTTGFVSAMPVFFGKKDASFQINDLIDLKGKSVAHMRAVKLLEDLIAPIKKDLTVIEVDNPLNAMTMVLEGKADIALGMNFDNYLLSQSFFLSGIEPVLVDTTHLVRAVTGIRADWPELVSILDKGLAKIGDQELVEVVRKWTQIEVPSARLQLTPAEKAWLNSHPKVIFSVPTTAPPLYYLDDRGEFAGINIDYMRLLAKRVGIKIEFKGHATWNGALDDAKKHIVDGIPNADATEDRKPYLNFTNVYSTFPQVIVTRGDYDLIRRFEDVSGKKIAVKRSSSRVYLLNDQYPESKIVEIDHIKEGLDLLVANKVDALYVDLAQVDVLLTSKFYTNLKYAVVAETPPVGLARIGLRNDDSMLLQIFNKAITTISREEHFAIKERWLPIGKPVVEQKIELTSKERAWLKEHPMIRVGADPDWGPIEFLRDDGSYQGFSIDLINRLALKLGVRFEFIRENWQELIALAKQGQLDLFSCVAKTPVRDEYLLFTETYIQMDAGLFAKEGVAYISDLNSLNDKKVAVVEGYAIHDYLVDEFPDLKLLLVKNPEEGIHAVLDGDAFVYVDNVITTGYLLSQKGYLQINLVGEVPFKFAQRMGVRKDWPILRDILQKAINNIPAVERTALYNQWVPLIHEKPSDYSLFWKIGAGCLIFICLIFFWNRKLATEVNNRTAELASNEKRLNAIFNHRFQLTGLLTPDGKLLMANENVCRLVGVDFKEIEGRYLWELPHWSHSEELQRQIQDSVESAKKGNLVNIETTHPDSEGTIHAIDFHLTPVRDENGEVIFIVPEGHDISERKKAEEALRESEEKYRTFFQNSCDAMLMIKDGLYFDCNTTAVNALGYQKAEEVLNLSPSEFSPKYQPDGKESSIKAKEMIDTAYEQGTHRFEWNHKRKDDSVIPVEVSLTAMPEHGERILLVVWRDISARKKAETEKELMQNQLSQSQKMEAIGTLAGGIAHDFNNILSAVIGYSEIALDDQLAPDAPARKSLENVLKAGLRAKDLVKQILAFSRQTEYEKKPVMVSPIVKEVLKLLRASLPSNIEIRQNLLSKDCKILGDPVQIHQVLMNLCTNAGYAMRETGGVLEVGLSSVEYSLADLRRPSDMKPGLHVVLAVTDTGPGMAPSVLDQIFNPFFTTKPKEEGTGLGLSVIHGIVTDHGGLIEVDSQQGKGTTFKVYFPQPADAGKSHAVSEIVLPSGNERILVVDDEESIVDTTRQLLKGLGYSVTAVTNSQKALDLFSRNPTEFDLVITDQTMPGISGDQLALKLMALRPDIPIILCTGFSHLIDEELAKSLGIRNFLFKPIIHKDLAITIRKALDQS